MKAGYLSTEFWLSLASQVVSVLVVLGVLKAEYVDVTNEIVGHIIIAVTLLLTNLGVAWKYVESRTRLKTENIALESQKLTLEQDKLEVEVLRMEQNS